MRFSRSESVVERSEDKVLRSSRSKKKHKRLDAICEKFYTRNHCGVEKGDLSNEGNVEGDGTDRRRSTRVRRAPEVLDASPMPPKKRRRMAKRGGMSRVEKMKRVVGVKSGNLCSTSKVLEEGEEILGAWRSRLRTRGKSLSFGGKQKENLSPKGKRKLFEDVDEVEEEGALGYEELDIHEEFVDGDLSAAKSNREGRVEVLSDLHNEHQEIDLVGGVGDEKEVKEEEALGSSDEGNSLLLKAENECGNDDGSSDCLGSPKLVEKENIEVQTGSQLEEHHGDDNAEMQLDNEACTVGKNQIRAVEVDGSTADQAKDEECHNKPLEDESSGKLGKKIHASDDTLKPIRIKEGRRCGLCGGGTDGKPPKKLVQDGNGSDDEVSSGGSASEEPNYDIWDGFGDEPGWLGRLLGPVNDRFGIAGIWVHQQCAVWSPEV